MGQPSPLRTMSKDRRTWGTETSKYPQEEKTTVIPVVVASEPGLAQTQAVSAGWG